MAYKKGAKKSSSCKKASKKAIRKAVKSVLARTNERKYITTYANTGSLAATSSWYVKDLNLGTIVQGTANGQRIGNSIKVLYLELSMSLAVDPSLVVSQGDTFDCYVMLDKQCNGALANAASVFDSAGIAGFRNPELARRFQVLYHQRHEIALTGGGFGTANATVAIVPQSCYPAMKIAINKVVKYTANTAAVTSLPKYNVFMVYAVQNSANAVVPYISTRFYYTDA